MEEVVVSFNKLIKVQFSNGHQLTMKIINAEDFRYYRRSTELLINSDSPVAKAILGKPKGEKVYYSIYGKLYQVTVLEILP